MYVGPSPGRPAYQVLLERQLAYLADKSDIRWHHVHGSTARFSLQIPFCCENLDWQVSSCVLLSAPHIYLRMLAYTNIAPLHIAYQTIRANIPRFPPSSPHSLTGAIAASLGPLMA